MNHAPDSRSLYYFYCLLAFLIVFSFAWVAEDAYITFRVVDHFVAGYGLRWNINERVQVYTHPLWMLLHIPFYFIFGNIFLTTISIGAICTAAAIGVALKSTHSSDMHKTIFILLPLAASSSFRHFAISGLETPLVCLLTVSFFASLRHFTTRPCRSLAIAAFCILTRMDSIVMIAPALLWFSFRHRKTLSIPRAAAAFLPLIFWCAFCLVYYGFIFPNTKYAKLNTGVSHLDYAMQGLNYAKNFLLFDPLGCALILAALLTGIAGACSRVRREPVICLAAFGILLHCLYVVSIGGDFMAGRFFVLPLFLSIWLLAQTTTGISAMRQRWAFAALLAMFMASFVTAPFYQDRGNYAIHDGIAVEREVYPENTLLTADHTGFRMRLESEHHWKTDGKNVANNPYFLNHSIAYWNVGMFGYYAAPHVVIIDDIGLTDAFIARLPIPDPKVWRIGHFYRGVMPEYLAARDSGDSSKLPEKYRPLYEEITLITQGDIWSRKRWNAIAHANGL